MTRKSNTNIYGDFADVYDMMSADEHSLKMVPYTQRIFKRFRFNGREGLDLCCGTGSATLALAEAGYRMCGVDGSRSMLKQARAKTRGAHKRAEKTKFYEGLLPKFRSSKGLTQRERFDFVVSYYDSLNYLLTEEELGTAFLEVCEALRPGGMFVFDMNTNEALKTIWGGQVYAGFTDKMAWIWKNQYYARAKMADARTVFFVRQGKSNNWRRFEETHTERAYSEAVIKRHLRKAGMETLAIYRCFSFAKAKPHDYRICVVAKKR